MVGLHRSNDVETLEFLKVIRRDDLIMLNAEAEIFLACLLLCIGKGIKRHARSAVSNGVKTKLEVIADALCRQGIEFVLLIARNASILRIVTEGRQHG